MAIDPTTERGAHALDRLAKDRIGWLTTVTPDGQPQTLPVWFLWEADEVLVYSFKRAVRNRNVSANPRVSFHLGDDGTGSDLVIIEGPARIDGSAPAPKDHAAYLAKYADWLADYQWTPEYFSEEYPVPIRVHPERVRGV